MKFYALFTTIFLLALTSYADGCKEGLIELTLKSNADSACAPLKLEGIYRLKICESTEEGTIQGSNGRYKYIYKIDGNWVSRTDSIDYDKPPTSTTEIFALATDLSTFTFIKVKEDNKGKVLESVECKGTAKIFSNSPPYNL